MLGGATSTTLRLWRVFPWDPTAADGAPFSPSYVTPRQVDGRFDLHGNPLVLNLGESPAHAIAEQIQDYHGRRLEQTDLTESGRPLAVVEVRADIQPGFLADLCDPRQLSRFGCRPDELMSRTFGCPQAISRRLHDAGLSGFRVWSALTGDWHCTVLFMDRVSEAATITFDTPTRLTIDQPALRDAAEVLEIRLP
jgi:hypothetical protein